MINEFLENLYDEVFYDEFYRELFPVGSFEEKGIYEDGKYNGIAVSIGAGDKKVRRYTITDDLEKIDELVSGDDFCLMSPISYIGNSRKSENARHLYAMAIDVDGINGDKGMRFFLQQSYRIARVESRFISLVMTSVRVRIKNFIIRSSRSYSILVTSSE